MTANAKNAAKSKAAPLIRDEKLRGLYQTMLQCRALEARARLLSQEGRFPFPGSRISGQEATEVSCTIDLRSGDSVVSADRDFIFQFIQGRPLEAAISQLGMRSINAEDADASLTLSGKIARPSFNAGDRFGAAARRALASKKGCVVVVFSHDHPLSSPGFGEEALALAGAQSLPILFVVQCVSGEGSAGAKARPKIEDFSSRSHHHGFPGIPVDGNDAVAVYRVAHESIVRARRGGGPTLMECKTYPYNDRAERGRKSRLHETVNGWGNDPIQYMEEYLSRKGLFSEAWKNQVAGEFARKLDAVFETTGATASH